MTTQLDDYLHRLLLRVERSSIGQAVAREIEEDRQGERARALAALADLEAEERATMSRAREHEVDREAALTRHRHETQRLERQLIEAQQARRQASVTFDHRRQVLYRELERTAPAAVTEFVDEMRAEQQRAGQAYRWRSGTTLFNPRTLHRRAGPIESNHGPIQDRFNACQQAIDAASALVYQDGDVAEGLARIRATLPTFVDRLQPERD